MTATGAGQLRLPGTRLTVDRADAEKVWDAAMCGQVGGDLWFPEKGDAGQAANARAVCARCEVTALCLATFGPVVADGIVGGLTGSERRRARRDGRAA